MPTLPPDALRCIKALDGMTWKGRTVKAVFGTTKYCNAFLKGLPCNNPDCLYLHEAGARGRGGGQQAVCVCVWGGGEQAMHGAEQAEEGVSCQRVGGQVGGARADPLARAPPRRSR